MNIVVQQSDPFATASDALIVPVGRVDGAPDFDVIALPALRDQLASLVSDADFTGKTGSTLLVQTMGLAAPRRLILTGVGDLDALTAESIRKAWGTAVTTARDAGAESVISLLPPASGDLSAAAALTQATAAADMATYRFTNYQGTVKNAKPVKEIDTLAFATDGQSADLAAALETGRAIAAAVSLARDLTNEPGSDLPPMAFAAAAEQVAADHGLEITVYDAAALQEMGANAILAVGKGSANPPCMIHIVYRPAGASESTPSIGLVGKCITFDTGGYSIKPADGMGEMKGDMGGGAAVLGAMAGLQAAGVQATVHAVICAAENKISGRAFLPGDVITGMNGVTMEIISTDAEGRLVMADGLVYLSRQGVREMVDLSTLTGAKIVALGDQTVALFSNNDDLAARLLDAAASAGEPMWRMPLSEHLESQIEAEIADIKNTGGRAGGAITAALFLQHFSEGLPWAHLDIAGSNRTTKASAYTPRGSTGVMVRTLLDYLQRSGS